MRSRLLAGILLAWPAWVWAHSPVPGLGRFYNGMLHPVLAPAALIALAALGVLIGQQGLTAVRRAVLGLVVSLLAGLSAGSQWPGVAAEPAVLAMGLVAAGCALAAWRPPALALLVLGCTIGAAAGVSLSDMATGDGRWVVVAGTWLGAGLLVLGVAAVAELARRPWQQIALRVLASWLAASAALVLGLQWAGPLRAGSPGATGAAACPPASCAATRACTPTSSQSEVVRSRRSERDCKGAPQRHGGVNSQA